MLMGEIGDGIVDGNFRQGLLELVQEAQALQMNGRKETVCQTFGCSELVSFRMHAFSADHLV